MKRISVALAVIAVVVAASASTAAVASAAQTYSDPSGDSGTAADITSVEVSNDAAGKITLALSFANRTAPTADDLFALFLDSDKNAATGDTRFGGADYAIFVDNGERTIDMVRWTGSAWDDTPQTTLQTSDGRTIAVNRSELGNTSGFNFLVVASNQAGDQLDVAPNGPPLFAYDLTAGTPAVPEITGILIPATVLFPKAGAVMNARAIQLRVDDALVRPTSIKCTLRFKGKALKPLAGGCRWKIPKALKGKSLTLTFTATYRGATTQQSYPVKVS